MTEELKAELRKALEHIDPHWKIQDDENDEKSKFIYDAETYDEVVSKARENGCDVNYALCRWYNYKTSKECERIFAEHGATPEKNEKHHSIDFYLCNEHFDLKVTVYPASLPDHSYDLTTRIGKNAMIYWYYKHQSQGGRKHFANRLFIVCDGADAYENLKLKMDFEQIEEGIKAYVDGVNAKGFNSLYIADGGETHHVKSDIIYIKSRH